MYTKHLIEKNIRKYLQDLTLGKAFLDMKLKEHAAKEKKIDKLDSFKIKSFCPLKDIIEWKDNS